MTGWVWLGERDALVGHDRSLSLHGGAAGVRDVGLLESALARPRRLAAYRVGADVIDLAAVYTSGIVKNHPFIDGNNRTGFLLGILFLELNRVRFIADEDKTVHAVLGLAAGTLDDAGYAVFLRQNVEGG